jgi:hypothetical protein
VWLEHTLIYLYKFQQYSTAAAAAAASGGRSFKKK